MTEICFNLQGKRFCIPIFVLIPEIRIPVRPEPDPAPWLTDLRILSTIDILAEGLPSPLRGSVQNSVASVVKTASKAAAPVITVSRIAM